MNKYLGTSAIAVAVAATGAHAGGVERSTQSTAVLFEKGRYLEFSASGLDPRVSGVGGLISTGIESGDMSGSQLNFGFAYRADLSDTLSYALIYDQPYGAKVNYPVSTYFAAGSTAELKSHALTGILQYNMASNVSLYGGLRAQTLEAVADVPFLGSYSAVGERDFALGYLLGVAYEKPEIALRVALTYNSAIDHELDTTETSALGAGRTSVTPIETPQSWNLEFQTGIAQDTLLFGSVRWVDWTAFDISPDDYATVSSGGSLVSFSDDRTTYTLGLGRRLNETWSVLGSLSYEEHTGSPTGNLGPSDGRLGVAVGAVYTKGNMKVTGGISYIDVGDARTQVGAVVPGGIFENNSAIAAGIKVGWTF